MDQKTLVYFSLPNNRFKHLLKLCSLTWKNIRLQFTETEFRILTSAEDYKPNVKKRKENKSRQLTFVYCTFAKEKMSNYHFKEHPSTIICISLSPSDLCKEIKTKGSSSFKLIRKGDKYVLSHKSHGISKKFFEVESVNKVVTTNILNKYYSDDQPKVTFGIDFIRCFQETFKQPANKKLEISIDDKGYTTFRGINESTSIPIFDETCNDTDSETEHKYEDDVKVLIKKTVNVDDCHWITELVNLNEGGLITFYCKENPKTPSIFMTSIGHQGTFIGSFTELQSDN